MAYRCVVQEVDVQICTHDECDIVGERIVRRVEDAVERAEQARAYKGVV